MCTNLLISFFSHTHPPSLNVIPRPVIKKEIVKYRHQRGRSPEITCLQRGRGSSGGATCLRSLFSDLFIEHPRGARLWAFMLRTWKAKIPQQLTGSWWKQIYGQTGHYVLATGCWRDRWERTVAYTLPTKWLSANISCFSEETWVQALASPFHRLRESDSFHLSLAGREWAVFWLPYAMLPLSGGGIWTQAPGSEV